MATDGGELLLGALLTFLSFGCAGGFERLYQLEESEQPFEANDRVIRV